ncbi:ketoisovalerate reductase [Xylaria digitata]|nr:ketoisovalerate reductase [Xylaria digitata]
MRVGGLSTKPALALQRQVVGMPGISTRLLHSLPRMQGVKSSREVSPEWLRRMIETDTEPPKLYAWTPKNLLAGGGTEPRSSQRSHTGPRTNGLDDDERRRIYILGVGNLGRLYAMCLSKHVDRPPITLVVHRKELLELWAANPGIELTRHGQVYRNADFDIEWWTDTAPGGNDIVEVAAGRNIGNLIVATKASDAMPQVDKVRRYLGSNSTVAFVQNGMCKLWPPIGDVYVRARFTDGPSWIACVTTHGVTSEGPFKSTHAAPANALVGTVMSNGVGGEQVGYLKRMIADAPDLDAQGVSRKQLWIAQLEKLVVNAVINPLTAVLRCKNGEIFTARDDAIPAIIDRLLYEASETLCALVLSSESDELLVIESASKGATSNHLLGESLGASREQLLPRFSFPRLRSMVLDVGAKVSANTSSMLQDVRADKPTEIDDFNGWLVDTARLLDQGLQLPTHEKLIALVKVKAMLTRDELCAELLEENDR